MSEITIAGMHERLVARLRERAAAHGVSVNEEARVILERDLAQPPQPPSRLGSALRDIFAETGGADLELPQRDPVREPPRFE